MDDLDVARRVVKDEVDMNMDGADYDGDEVPVQDEVYVREGKTTELEYEVPMVQGAEYFLQPVGDVVCYNNVDEGLMLGPSFSNYPVLSEQLMKHMNVLCVDLNCLKNFLYHPNMLGFHYYHKVMDKDRDRDITSCLEDGIFYPAEIKSV